MPGVLILIPPDAEPDEVAAIAAALALLTAAPGSGHGVGGHGVDDHTGSPRWGRAAPDSAWATAAALEAQDLPAAPGAVRRWGHAERSRRAGRWSSGIVGG